MATAKAFQERCPTTSRLADANASTICVVDDSCCTNSPINRSAPSQPGTLRLGPTVNSRRQALRLMGSGDAGAFVSIRVARAVAIWNLLTPWRRRQVALEAL